MRVVGKYQSGDGQILCLLTTGNRPSFRYPGRGRKCEWTHKASRPKSEEAWRRILCESGGAAPPALPGM
jgi:hypothetical protein